MIAVFVVLLTAVLLLFSQNRSARTDLKLAEEIRGNFQERISIRDQYFLHREEYMQIRWDENKQKSDQLLRQAKLQFKGEDRRQIIEYLISNSEETESIFHRIIANNKTLKSTSGNRELLDELNKRLSSQLILKSITIHDKVLKLRESTMHDVENSYRRIIIMVFVLAGLMALCTLLFSVSLMRWIRLRLVPLHEGTRNIGNGDLESRIKISGSDEFTDLAHSVNIMTDKLSVEIETRIKAEEELQHAKIAELERKRSEEAIRSLFEWTPVATIVHRDGRIIYTNPTAINMFGAVSQQDLQDKPFLDLIHKDFHQASLSRRALTDQGIAIPMVECKFIKLDGTVIDAEIQSTVFDYIGAKAYISCIIDITDRKKAEEEKHLLEQQFRQAQKLESLGVLAGGIAHDFNNILAIIVGYCSLTKMDYENAEKHIPEIEKAAERAAALCRQMLAYAGKAMLTQSQINTCMLVDEMVSMLKTTIKQNVVIKSELSTDIPFFIGDDSQIRQVVMNLIINAAEAIGDAEGEIDVKLSKVEIKAEQPEKDHLGLIIPAGHYIRFEVTDNGCGMDDETKRKIFEPFYTTKFTGRGLGMSAVLGIIKSHNGALQLESRLGHGTIFKVYLPVQIKKNESEEEQQIPASAPWQGSGTILLAEDEAQVKSIAIALLKKLGFKVIDAANGNEALELYQQYAADITLVVTDLGMPIMNGYELFYKLKQLNPKLPIIISSGFGEGDITSKIPREAMAGMINKPYSFDDLRDVLRGVVDGNRIG